MRDFSRSQSFGQEISRHICCRTMHRMHNALTNFLLRPAQPQINVVYHRELFWASLIYNVWQRLILQCIILTVTLTSQNCYPSKGWRVEGLRTLQGFTSRVLKGQNIGNTEECILAHLSSGLYTIPTIFKLLYRLYTFLLRFTSHRKYVLILHKAHLTPFPQAKQGLSSLSQ